jgi:hypothetical protein
MADLSVVSLDVHVGAPDPYEIRRDPCVPSVNRSVAAPDLFAMSFY